MVKRRTKEQKMLSNLRKLQSQQAHSKPIFELKNVPSTAENIPRNTYRLATTSGYYTQDLSYVKKDLVKILILGALAIGIQIVLSFLISNLGINISLLGRR